MRSQDRFTWIEQFDGSANSEGQVMLLNSSVGYLYGRYLLVDVGVPVYFVRAIIILLRVPELRRLTRLRSWAMFTDRFGCRFPIPR